MDRDGPDTRIDWMWVYENPREAAAMINALSDRVERLWERCEQLEELNRIRVHQNNERPR